MAGREHDILGGTLEKTITAPIRPRNSQFFLSPRVHGIDLKVINRSDCEPGKLLGSEDFAEARPEQGPSAHQAPEMGSGRVPEGPRSSYQGLANGTTHLFSPPPTCGSAALLQAVGLQVGWALKVPGTRLWAAPRLPFPQDRQTTAYFRQRWQKVQEGGPDRGRPLPESAVFVPATITLSKAGRVAKLKVNGQKAAPPSWRPPSDAAREPVWTPV